jgi:hypothetical protein
MAVELAGSLGAVALFAVPGYGVTELLPPLRRLPPVRRAAYGYLLGVAVVGGTLYAASHFGGIPLRAPAVWTAAALPALAGILAAALRQARRRRAHLVSPPVPPVESFACPEGTGRRRASSAPPEGAGGGHAGGRHAERRAPDRRSRFSPPAIWTALAAWLRRLGGPLPAACALVAALVCCGLLAEAASDPVHDWDGRMTWTAQARYIRAAGTVDAEALRNGRWYVSHPQYPLLLPIAQAAALEAFGAGADSHLQRGIYAAFFPALLLLIYDGARRGAGRIAAALAVTAAASVPFFTFGEGGAFSTYSDLPLACFYGAAVLLLLAPRPDLAGGLAAGLLLAAAALTKNEGALLGLLALALGWRSVAGPRRRARPRAAVDAPDEAQATPAVAAIEAQATPAAAAIPAAIEAQATPAAAAIPAAIEAQATPAAAAIPAAIEAQATPAAAAILAAIEAQAIPAAPPIPAAIEVRTTPAAATIPAAIEGLAAAAPDRPRRRAALRFAAAALPLALALTLLASWRSAIPDRQDENYPDLVKEVRLWPDAVTRVAVFAPVMWRQMTRFHHWAGFWWMAPVVLLAGRRALRRPRNRRLLAAAAGPPAIAWAAYSVHTNPGFLAAVTWERFLLQGAVPLLVLLACALAEVRRHFLRSPRRQQRWTRPAASAAAALSE